MFAVSGGSGWFQASSYTEPRASTPYLASCSASQPSGTCRLYPQVFSLPLSSEASQKSSPPTSFWHSCLSLGQLIPTFPQRAPCSLHPGVMALPAYPLSLPLPGPLLCFLIDPRWGKPLSLTESLFFPEGIIIYFPKRTSFTL